MHNYRVKFYFASDRSGADVTMFERAETMAEISEYLTRAEYQTFIDRAGGPAVVVHLAQVTKIEITEV